MSEKVWLNQVETRCTGTRWREVRVERRTLGLVVVSGCSRYAQTSGPKLGGRLQPSSPLAACLAHHPWDSRALLLSPPFSPVYHPWNFQTPLLCKAKMDRSWGARVGHVPNCLKKTLNFFSSSWVRWPRPALRLCKSFSVKLPFTHLSELNGKKCPWAF